MIGFKFETSDLKRMTLNNRGERERKIDKKNQLLLFFKYELRVYLNP